MRQIHQEDKIGLSVTIIFHLMVVIILLLSKISQNITKESSFVVDFEKQEELEKQKEEEEFKDMISKKLEELLNNDAYDLPPIRNLTSNLGNQLKDDRGTDAGQLYKDAEELSRKLKEKHQEEMKDDFAEMPQKIEERNHSAKEYSGPSVLSWQLDGRKAIRLPIPAYKCYKGGTVTVTITVDNSGNVIKAKINTLLSTEDECLRNFAINAAMLSRFSASASANPKQIGEIVYQFLAQ